MSFICPVCHDPQCGGFHDYVPLTPVKALEWAESFYRLLEIRASDTLSELMSVGDFAGIDLDEWIRSYGTVLEMIRKAQLVLWGADKWTAATKGADVFYGTKIDPNVFVPPLQLWVPDRDFFYSDGVAKILNIEPRSNMVATFVYCTRKEVFFMPLIGPAMSDEAMRNMPREQVEAYMLKNMYYRIRPHRISLSKPIPDVGHIAEAVALANFMQQPVVELQTSGLPRAERRRRQKAGEAIPTVHVVSLRRVQHATTSAGEVVDWKYRWLVSGHWRKQWHPSTKTHKPTFISTYVKGPEGKPLKTPAKSIYVVKH